MRRWQALFIALLLACLSGSASGQQPAPTAPAPTEATVGAGEGTGAVFSTSDMKEARETLQVLATGLGVEPMAQAPADPPAKKTVADVADKALDMTAKFVIVIAGKMEKVAPHVWEVMVRQQYAKAIGDLVAPFGLFWCTIIAAVITRRFWKLSDVEKEKELCESKDGPFSARGWRGFFTFFIPLVVCIGVGGLCFYRFADSVMYLINPEYYAVKDLLTMLLKPGGL